MSKPRPGFDPRAAAAAYADSLKKKNSLSAEESAVHNEAKNESADDGQTLLEKALRDNPPTSKKKKRTKTATSIGNLPRTYLLSEVTNTALDLCSKKTGYSRSGIVHSILGTLDSRYFELGKAYLKVREAFENGDSPDSIEELKYTSVTRATKKYNTIEGLTVSVCIMTERLDDAALEMKSRETGLTRGAILDEMLRQSLSEYMELAKEWIERAKAFGIR